MWCSSTSSAVSGPSAKQSGEAKGGLCSASRPMGLPTVGVSHSGLMYFSGLRHRQSMQGHLTNILNYAFCRSMFRNVSNKSNVYRFGSFNEVQKQLRLINLLLYVV